MLVRIFFVKKCRVMPDSAVEKCSFIIYDGQNRNCRKKKILVEMR